MGLFLHAAADVLTQKDLPVVITFLISRALVCEMIGITSGICVLLCTLLLYVNPGNSFGVLMTFCNICRLIPTN